MVEEVYKEIKKIVDFDSPLLLEHIEETLKENKEFLETFEDNLKIPIALRLCGVGFKKIKVEGFKNQKDKNDFFKNIEVKDNKALISLRNKVVKTSKEKKKKEIFLKREEILKLLKEMEIETFIKDKEIGISEILDFITFSLNFEGYNFFNRRLIEYILRKDLNFKRTPEERSKIKSRKGKESKRNQELILRLNKKKSLEELLKETNFKNLDNLVEFYNKNFYSWREVKDLFLPKEISLRSIERNVKKSKNYKEKKTFEEILKDTIFKDLDNLVDFYNKNSFTVREIKEKFFNEYDITDKTIEKNFYKSSLYKRKVSSKEKTFYRFLKETFKEVKVKDRTLISPLEIDFLIEEEKIAFEFNGSYWHSKEVVESTKGKSSLNYHKNKKKLLEEKGIRLFYIWEDDWEERTEDVKKLIKERNFKDSLFNTLEKESKRKYIPRKKLKSLSHLKERLNNKKINFKILDKDTLEIEDNFILKRGGLTENKENLEELLKKEKKVLTVFPWNSDRKVFDFIFYQTIKDKRKVFARNTEVHFKDKLTKEMRKLVEDNHILGDTKYKNLLKVFYLTEKGKDEILALAIFTEKSKKVELKRLIFKKEISLVGGASKLIENAQKFFKRDIVTFSDRNISEGEVYQKIGFERKKISAPQIFFFNPITKQKFSRLSLYTVGADRLLKKQEGYVPHGKGENLPTNEEIVLANGFLKFEDCGNILWEKKWRG